MRWLRAAADAKHPAELRPGEGGHFHLGVRAAGVREWKWSTASRAPVLVKGGGPTPPSPAREPARPMRLIGVASALSSERREEVGVRSQDPPVCPAAPRGDEDASQGALGNPAARRTRPEAGVALRKKDGAISEGTENSPTTSVCASHDPPWKGCEAPRAVCDRGAVAARGRAAAAEADEVSTSIAAPLCGRDALVQTCARQAGFGRGQPQGRAADPLTNHGYLTAKHSAHAETRAAMPCLLSEGLVGARGRTLRIAPATGQSAIAAAQGTHHGVGGVGRGHWP